MTIALLATSGCLVTWIYLRDRDTTNTRAPEQQLARADATAANDILGANCRSHCATELLGRTGPHSWLVRVTLRGRPECLEINLETFAVSEQSGMSGVQRRSCALLAKAP